MGDTAQDWQIPATAVHLHLVAGRVSIARHPCPTIDWRDKCGGIHIGSAEHKEKGTEHVALGQLFKVVRHIIEPLAGISEVLWRAAGKKLRQFEHIRLKGVFENA